MAESLILLLNKGVLWVKWGVLGLLLIERVFGSDSLKIKIGDVFSVELFWPVALYQRSKSQDLLFRELFTFSQSLFCRVVLVTRFRWLFDDQDNYFKISVARIFTLFCWDFNFSGALFFIKDFRQTFQKSSNFLIKVLIFNIRSHFFTIKIRDSLLSHFFDQVILFEYRRRILITIFFIFRRSLFYLFWSRS